MLTVETVNAGRLPLRGLHEGMLPGRCGEMPMADMADMGNWEVKIIFRNWTKMKP
jgi:hypothetical protein